MQTEDQSPVGDETAAGFARIEEQLMITFSDVSQDNRAEKKDSQEKTDEGAVPANISPTSSLIESSTAPVAKLKPQSASSDAPISSTTSRKGIALCQVKELEDSSASCANAANSREENMEDQQTLNSSISLPSIIPDLTTKNEGKEVKQNTASTISTAPSTYSIRDDEGDKQETEPSTFNLSPTDAANWLRNTEELLRNTEELLRNLAIRKKSFPADGSQSPTPSRSNKENIGEHQTLSSASSLPSAIPGLTTKNVGKEIMQSNASTISTVPSTDAIKEEQGDGKETEPSTFYRSPSRDAADLLRKTEELLRNLAVRKRAFPADASQSPTPSTSNEAEITGRLSPDISTLFLHSYKAVNKKSNWEEMQMNISSASSSSVDEARLFESWKLLAHQKVAFLEGRPQSTADSLRELDIISRDASIAVSETSSVASHAGDHEMKLTEPENCRHRSTEHLEDAEIEDERKAFFYISSSSIPGMGKESEWPSVSGGYQMPEENTRRRLTREDSREPCTCLGSRKCHYVVLVVAFLTSIIGCVTYHLQETGMGPEILKPIGASTAFISFAVCAFSSVYLSYLSNYPLMPAVPNYELLGDAESVLAMNRAANPQCHYSESGYYISRSQSMPDEECYRETQSADILDRRGYGKRSVESQQSEMRRSVDGPGSLDLPRSPRED